MSTRDELDRRLASWMAETASGRPPAGGLEEAIEATRRRRPRPRWLAPLGSDWVGTDVPRLVVPAWPRLSRQLVTAAIVALLLAVAIVGAALIGAQILRPDTQTWRLGSLAYEIDGDIYLADANGANARRVADGVPDVDLGGSSYSLVRLPVWAPDGRHFLFEELRGAPGERQLTVHVSDATGRVLASIPGIWDDATWSPDSTRLQAWIGNIGSTRIGIYGIDGAQQASLPVPDGYSRWREYGGVWGPDGRSVWVFLQTAPGRNGLWQLPIDGSAPREIEVDDPIAGLYDLTFSPDGTRLAGTAFYNGTAYHNSLVVADADATELRTIVEGDVGLGDLGTSDPVWSPTGRELAYVWAAAQTFEVRVVDISSGTTRTLLDGPRANGRPLPLGWSPAGDRILLGLFDDQYRPISLSSLNADGVGRTLLIEGASIGAWQWIRVP